MADPIIGIKITGDGKDLETALNRAAKEVREFGDGVAKAKAPVSDLAVQTKAAFDATGVRDFGREVTKAQEPVTTLSQSLRTAFIGSSVIAGLLTLKSLIQGATSAMVQAQIDVDRLRNGLNFAVGRDRAAGELEFLRSTTQQLGLEFVSTAGAYTKLAAAARGTSMEGKGTRDIFTAIAQASTVMNLSVEQSQGVLLAVTQMISKGKVQAEELRGQLAERLPGAFQIAARAMGVTEAELNKMLETGKVLSEDFLPKFARQLSQEVGPEVQAAANGMAQSISRLSNAWTEFRQNAAKSGISDSIGWFSGALANDITAFSEALERARLSGKGTLGQWNDAMGMLIGRSLGLRLVNRDFMTMGEAIQDSSMKLKELDERLLKFGHLSIYDQAARGNAIRDLARAMDLLNAKTGYIGGSDIRIGRLRAQSDAPAIPDAPGVPTRSGVDRGDLTLSNLRGRVDAERENLAALRESGSEADKLNEGQKLALRLQEQLSTKLDAKTRALKLAELAAANELGAFLYAQGRMKDGIRLEQERTRARQESYAQSLREQEEIAQAEVQASKAREQGREAVSSFLATVQEQNDYVALEISLLGESEARRKDALDQYQIELDLKRRIAEIDRNAGFDEAQREEERARVRAAAARDLAGRRNLSGVIAERERNPFAGASDGINQYLETVRNVADSTKTMMVNAFQGMEDALVSFVRTGKLDFKSLANSIISDFARIQIRQSITGPLAQSASGDLSGGGGLLSTVLSFLPKFDTGIEYVPYDMPAIIHKGERVVTAAENRRGVGSFAPVYNIQIDSRADRSEARREIMQALEYNNREMFAVMRRTERFN